VTLFGKWDAEADLVQGAKAAEIRN